jgi:hypothetical protein
MVSLNFYIQLLLFTISVMIGASSLYDEGSLFLLLYVQMALGFSQYIGGILLFLNNRLKLLKHYLLISTTLLLGMFMWAELKLPTNHVIGVVGVFVMPWLLAIYYWFISYRLYTSKR